MNRSSPVLQLAWPVRAVATLTPPHPQPSTFNLQPPTPTPLLRRPELVVFIVILALLNAPVVIGSYAHSFVFQSDAVRSGEWWRLLTHSFVHLTWYHLLLDATAFLALYSSLLERNIVHRFLYVFAGGAGSLLLAWAAAPALATSGLCGLSGIAHGLMAVSALEMVGGHARDSAERRIGLISFILVVAKAAFEALTGRLFFPFLDFGLLGTPVAVAHAGGIVGSLIAMLVLRCEIGRAHV